MASIKVNLVRRRAGSLTRLASSKRVQTREYAATTGNDVIQQLSFESDCTVCVLITLCLLCASSLESERYSGFMSMLSILCDQMNHFLAPVSALSNHIWVLGFTLLSSSLIEAFFFVRRWDHAVGFVHVLHRFFQTGRVQDTSVRLVQSVILT